MLTLILHNKAANFVKREEAQASSWATGRGHCIELPANANDDVATLGIDVVYLRS